ncbi:hypothetical protein O6H91_04G037400 [Diphasiastrum complanatum]|uniref:Uncharacterized protein n=1 Tax=Diphasiastrum complanatum TaxID=34168 RepID=A0ACC2DW08_DIPCM|nr:hypothetical protein O6H91_04G037400 [Diphasiastrum complanatum]
MYLNMGMLHISNPMHCQERFTALPSFAAAAASTRLEKQADSNKRTPSRIAFCIPPTNHSRLKKHEKRGLLHWTKPDYAAATRPRLFHVDVEPLTEARFFHSTSLSAKWRDIQGAENWDGLLDPIDPDLRQELIRYGEFAQVCYDAFDFEKHSKYCGSCKYNRRKVLEKVGLKYAADYEVTKYLYSTSDINLPDFFHRSDNKKETWSRDSNWMGFVAISTSASEIQRLGRRDIVVAWRGTVTSPEWICNLEDWLSPSALGPAHQTVQAFGSAKIERGFRSIYTSKKQTSRYNRESAQEQLLSEIRRLLKEYQGDDLSITVTGHSLGGALALLSAYDIAESAINTSRSHQKPLQQRCSFKEHCTIDRSFIRDLNRWGDAASENVPITVFTFAGPRVGNDAFRDRCEELGIKTLRVVNEKDIVPKVPGLVLNEHMHHLRSWIDKLPWTYSHVGVELALNTQDSTYLKGTGFFDLASHHNLEAYLHLLDGYRSTQQRFCSFDDHRDLTLVNKFSDLLKPEYCIPPYWWQEENKGLQKNAKGIWVRRDREEEHIPIVYRDA